jgi:ABC-2 type transport system ATP-binding protein
MLYWFVMNEPHTNTPAIVVHDLYKRYDTGTEALKKISLSIEAGDFFALLGPNGAGKTTLIGILAGLTNKTSGHGEIFGASLDTQVDSYRKNLTLIFLKRSSTLWSLKPATMALLARRLW